MVMPHGCLFPFGSDDQDLDAVQPDSFWIGFGSFVRDVIGVQLGICQTNFVSHNWDLTAVQPGDYQFWFRWLRSGSCSAWSSLFWKLFCRAIYIASSCRETNYSSIVATFNHMVLLCDVETDHSLEKQHYYHKQ
jgi:hypothetical protein